MEDWKIFEIKTTEFLNNYFSNTGFTFKSTGGSDSTSSDIGVYFNNNFLKSIEVKCCPAQSGQIVILPEDGEFVFSSRSVYKNNPYSKEIIEHMNKHFKKYNKVSTSGIPIDCDKSIFFKWIQYHYTHNKNSDFVIAGTLDKLKKNIKYINFIKFSEIENNFTVTCPYRKKRSGTSELPKKDENIFLTEFNYFVTENNLKLLNKYWTSVAKNKNKFFIEINKYLNKSDRYFECGDFTSFLSYKSESQGKYKYEVKKRSNTNNPNIVYTLDLLYTNPNYFGIKTLSNYLHSLK